MTPDGSTVFVLLPGSQWLLLDRDGKLKQQNTNAESISCAALSPNGRLIALGCEDGLLKLLELRGAASVAIYSQQLAQTANSITFSGDSSVVIVTAGAEINVRSVLPGGRGWRRVLPATVSASSTNWCASIVAAAGADGSLLLLDAWGGDIRQLQLEGKVLSVAVDDSGDYFAAVVAPSALHFFQLPDTLLWSHPTGGPQVGLTYRASRIARISPAGEVVILDRAGHEASKVLGTNSQTRHHPSLEHFSLSGDGTLLAVAGRGSIRCFRLGLKPIALNDDVRTLVSRRTVLSLRSGYLDNSTLALCRWIDEFDLALSHARHSTCDALHTELLSGGYVLDDVERAWADDRSAALALSRGIELHRAGRFDDARILYQQGLDTHRLYRNRDGVGQSLSLLSELDSFASDGFAVLDAQQANLKVLGSGEALLTKRTQSAALPDRLNALRAARQLGYMEPVYQALGDPDLQISTAAIALLERLTPGPSVADLVVALRHPNWFVRWRSAIMLAARTEQGLGPETAAELLQALAVERDPNVLRELAMLSQRTNRREAEKRLLPLLVDPDPEVRCAGSHALAEVGGVAALAKLPHVADGATFLGIRVSTAARAAMARIEASPPARVTSIAVLEAGSSEKRRIVHCAFSRGAQLLVETARLHGNAHAQFRAVRPEGHDGFVVDVCDQDYPSYEQGAPTEALIELLDSERVFQDPNRNGIRLPFPIPLRPGKHRVSVYLNGDLAFADSFRAVDKLNVGPIQVGVEVNGSFHPSDLFLVQAGILRCTISLTGAPRGAPLLLRLRGPERAILLDSILTTAVEGDQVLATALPEGFLNYVGAHTVEALEGKQIVASIDFRVISEVATSLSLVSPNPGTRRGTLVDETTSELVGIANLEDAPPGVTVAIKWLRRGSGNVDVAVASEVFMTDRRGGHSFRSSINPPQEGWDPGQYALEVVVGNRSMGLIRFDVVGPPWLERLNKIARRRRYSS